MGEVMLRKHPQSKGPTRWQRKVESLGTWEGHVTEQLPGQWEGPCTDSHMLQVLSLIHPSSLASLRASRGYLLLLSFLKPVSSEWYLLPSLTMESLCDHQPSEAVSCRGRMAFSQLALWFPHRADTNHWTGPGQKWGGVQSLFRGGRRMLDFQAWEWIQFNPCVTNDHYVPKCRQPFMGCVCKNILTLLKDLKFRALSSLHEIKYKVIGTADRLGGWPLHSSNLPPILTTLPVGGARWMKNT